MDSPMMCESQTLLNAQISFLNTHVALIHIPMTAYPYFLRPIAQLLLHNTNFDSEGIPIEPRRPWEYWHPLVNISIAHNECSITCPRELADELFAPVIAGLKPELQKSISISKEDYSVIVIDGEGLEAGQRVLDLSSPLALAKIPIFFITSYWSDFILVPLKSRPTVIHALEDRGFLFEASDPSNKTNEAGFMTNPASPLLHRTNSSITSFDFPPTPTTPPPTSVSELQQRTFTLLKAHRITPTVDASISLVTCAGIKPTFPHPVNSIQTTLQHSLLSLLSAPTPPRFLSLTLSESDSPSLTLERSLLSSFPENVILGMDGPTQVPVTLDLHSLPLQSTGIVCGVASRLVDGMKGRFGAGMGLGLPGGFEMSYLSTARAGHVVVYEEELEDAMEVLQGLGEA
ncbi:hypothetical protein Q7P37_000882 [Cladosporium fusiforme]